MPFAMTQRRPGLAAGAGFVASRQIFVPPCHFWTTLNPAAPRHDEWVIAMTNEAGRTDP
jgi:hypothetical protein